MATDRGRTGPTAVYLEVGSRRVFAGALDWPGWARSGKDEALALEALADYAPRYAVVAERAGLAFPATAGDELRVVEQVAGSATTDFGALDRVVSSDTDPVGGDEAERFAALLRASWAVFDAVVAVLGAPSDGTPAAPKGWPARYAVRRFAWHVLDHAWEIQDRSVPAG